MNILKTYWSTKLNDLCWQYQSQKSLQILGDGASGCPSGDIEQVIVKVLFKIW